MSVSELLTELAQKHIALSVDQDDLIVSAEDGALDSSLLSLLQKNKRTIVELIRAGEYSAPRATVVQVPPNGIPADCEAITPPMLPLVELTQEEIERIVATVPGGAANVQDIYPLAPLQEGMLFHHLMGEQRDPYLQWSLFSFDGRGHLDRFVAALREVIERHDVLRTAVLWERLREPVQVVWRRAPLLVEKMEVGPVNLEERLREQIDSGTYRLDIRQAPLMRLFVAEDRAQGRWLLLWLHHHLIGDHTTADVLRREIGEHLAGRQSELPAPLSFRNFVAQARRGVSREEHEAFFKEMLGDVDEPTVPFGLSDVRGDGSGLAEKWQQVDVGLARRLRTCARELGLSVASLCHLAFGRVLAQVSGRDDVVFGTVLFGRMQGGEGADWAPGLFMNTLPVRVRVKKEGVERAARAMQVLLARLLRHEHTTLALAQHCSGVAAPAPLFAALLNYRHSVIPPPRSQGVTHAAKGIRFLRGMSSNNYPFALEIDDFGEGLSLFARVKAPVEPSRVCGYMNRALEELVEALEEEPQKPLRELQVLPEEERREVLVEWNRTAAQYPQDRCLHELFEAQVQRTPEAVAVWYEGRQVSYRELNARANRVAHYLRGLGVGPDVVVGLCVERSAQMVVGLFGILKAGGAYLPLDAGYPTERLGYLLGDAAPRVVLTQQRYAPTLVEQGARVVCLDADEEAIESQADTDVAKEELGLSARNLAYVIYTSGSSGRPKGVMVEHRSIANYCHQVVRELDLERSGGALLATPIGFDLTLTALLAPLLCGQWVKLCEEGNELQALRSALEEGGELGLLKLTPSHVMALRQSANQGQLRARISNLLLGGEALAGRMVRWWRKNVSAGRIINEYGPTETTIGCIAYEVPESLEDAVPIGRPMGNTRAYVLDGRGEPVPIGAVGELYIGGVGVARGYLNRPELTAERFVADPYAQEPGERMYRTGDLARYRADGNLEFLGRNDFQVKVRGFRIELGEIEAQLTGQAGVAEAVVVVRGEEAAEQRLVAYYTRTTDVEEISASGLRGALAKVLPEHMVPSAYVELTSLPLTANGKLDRKALPEPGQESLAASRYEPPQGETEELLAGIWSEVLKVERVGRHDNFFELGGHSLLVVQLVSRILQSRGVEIGIPAVFQNPTLQAMAAAIEPSVVQRSSAIPRASRERLLPLSLAQQRLWFLAQLEVDASNAYHIRMALRWRGSLDSAALHAALDRIVERHESLRTSFVLIDGVATQRIAQPRSGFALLEQDLSGVRNADEQLQRLILDDAESSLDLAVGPPTRGRLLRLSDREHVLLMTMHHIVADRWSLSVLFRELAILYAAYSEGKEDPLPPLEIQYADYAVWQRESLGHGKLQGQGEYWQERLNGAPPLLTLPTDRDRPATQDYSGDAVGVEIDEQLTARLKQLSQRHGTTLFTTILTAWGALLSRLSGQDEVVIGTPVANRSRTELEPLIGLFLNTLAIRIDLSGRPTTKELLSRVREQVIGAQANQDLPFEQLVDLLKPERSLAHTPLFQVMLAWQNVPTAEGLDLPGVSMEGLSRPTHAAQFDLTLSLEVGGRIAGSIVYAKSLFDRPTITSHVEYLKKTLEGMVVDDERAVQQFDILAESQRQRLLVDWNATACEYRKDRCLHELFEAQVRRTPDAVAVSYEGQQVSYRELNARANRLAHHLRGLGVGPDRVVALCVQRSVEMVVGLLGILKAGGAYLPLDPSYPLERLAYMVSDSTPVVVLTHADVEVRVREALRELAAEAAVLDLRGDAESWSRSTSTNLHREAIGLTPKHLAYVIYTSGSTGRPKGVMVPHEGVGNRLAWMQAAYGLDQHDAILQKTPYSFDVSVWEFFWPLLTGAKLVMARPEGHKDARYLVDVIRRERITTLHFVPSMLQAFVGQEHVEACSSVQRVVCSGEALAGSLARRCKERLIEAQLYNLYGPTEATVDVTAWTYAAGAGERIPIGRPIANTHIYVLDGEGEPVPVGVTGELYIGGAGVARGYLNRPELTAERFVPDAYGEEPGARLYRTGDLARYRADGNLEFLGRNDFQVKVRGFRIELGEIEAQLRACPGIGEAVVVVRGEQAAEQRLVAYYTRAAGAEPPRVEALRSRLLEGLPEHMVPAAYVELEALPLTANGKLDRKGLPEPGDESYVARGYEPPRGEAEETLAGIWSEVLGVERVGRQDNFFELGGHSLLAVTVIERMRRAGLHADVGALFTTPTLSALAAAVGGGSEPIEVPPNGIPGDCEAITPPMLPLVELTQEEIERIVATVPGGAANVQDIYPLAPLQEGMLFHHLMGAGRDPYVQWSMLGFDSREQLDGYVAALRAVIARHDILRTAVVWEGLREPVQVVWRRAALVVKEVEIGVGVAEDLLRGEIDPAHYRLDVRQAPLMRLFIAEDRDRGRWALLWLRHHLIGDHTTAEVINQEIAAHRLGRQSELRAPLPFRNFVAQARRGVSREEHEAFFKEMLGDVDEPTMPFGFADVHGDGSTVTEGWGDIDVRVVRRLRRCARQLGVSVATLCHLAFGRVLAQVSRCDDVVFGTLLFGRMHGGEGVDWVPGLFMNTLPIRLGVGDEGVEAAARGLHALLARLLRHEHAPLALAQRCSAVAAPVPLFTALLNYRHVMPKKALSIDTAESARAIHMLGGEERTNYPFALAVNDFGERLSLIAHTQRPLEPKRICGYMNRVLEELVEALEREPQKPLRELEVMPEEERREVLVEWNRTAAQYPQDRCLHELFEAQVRRTPDAVAVSYEGQQVSYRELNARANRLAHHLRGLGVGPDRVVALCVERSVEMVVGLLGILKAGGAYLPLDPSYPLERLAYMVGDSTPMVVLTHAEVESSVREALRQVARGAAVVDLRADAPSWATCSATNPQREAIGLTPKHLAYVIYTSGSTGRPKGVMVEHAEVCNTALAQVRAFEVAPTSRVLQFASLSFDGCTWEVAMALCSGAVLQVPPASALLVGETLLSTLIESHTTHVGLPPAVLAGLPPEAASQLPALRILVSVGEALPETLSQRWAQGRRLINAYGATEAAIAATAYECGDGGAGAPPIGRPIANARTYVLDGRGEPVPVGVTGELYIGGAGVARGYLNRPELTAERFVPDAYGEEPGARLYRTGDLARYRADGNLEFLGRNDFQVKVRGFRIELGEIEAQLRACPGIGEAVVVVRGEQAAEQRLVAYYTRAAGAEPPRVEALRSRLLEGLPEHMVPAAYVELEALPLTANGKLDRKGLPEPGDESYVARGYEPPRGEAEETLAGIWSEVLGVERVGRQDNFFELGGHSLLAVTVIERMRRAGLHADVGALFTTPTLSALAAAVGGGSEPIEVPPNGIPGDCEAITPPMLPLVELTQEEIERIVATVPGGAANVQDIYPLVPLQEGMLFHHLLGDGRDPYVSSMRLGFPNRAELDKFVEALRGVIERHDVLRTAMVWEGLREPVQVVWRRAELTVQEVTVGPGDTDELLRRQVDSGFHHFDMRQAPLMRLFIAEDRERGRWVLLWLRHHIVGDHTTGEIIHQDILAHLMGRQSELPVLLPFRNFVVQARRGVSREEHEAFFKEMLGDVDEPTMPFGLSDVRGDGSGIVEIRRELDGDLAQRIRNCARRVRVSVASLCHLAFGRLLAAVSGHSDVVFGTVLFGRMQGGEGSDRVPGLLVNTLPMRVRADEGGVAVSVSRVHEHLTRLMRHEHASLALAQRCSGVAAPTPLFTALLNYRHVIPRRMPTAAEVGPGGAIESFGGQERTNYPFALAVSDLGERLSLEAQARAPLEAGRICGYMERVLKELVEALEREPHKPVRELRVLPEEERRELVVEWNRTARSYPADRCVHELFEEQVRRSPEAVALVGEGEKLTYREVNERANRLARYLRGRGVRAGEAVPVVMARSVRMVVSELAVLKCGAAYVPIDPEYPAQRQRWVMEDCGAKRVLGGEALPGFEGGAQWLDVGELGEELERESSEDLGVKTDPRAAAYVMYTSGSTGRPKGVVVEHGAVNARVVNGGYVEIVPEDCVAHCSSGAFDASTFEVWSGLLNGARVLIVPARVVLEPQELAQVLREGGVTVLHLTTELFNRYAVALGGVYGEVRYLLFGGEASDPRRVREVLERSRPKCLKSFYGPTETTAFAAAVQIERVEEGAQRIPIGRPIGNTHIYVLDGEGEPVPVGVTGELYIGGAGVARGYLNRPELTAERFVPDAYGEEPGARLYRTGDLARYRADGNLEFLGRNDFQVKVRGFRIELGEIEAQLRACPGIGEAVVVVRGEQAAEQRLVAYYTRAAGAEPPRVEALRSRLLEGLPEHMVPAAYVELEALPLTANGKLDRKGLPEPGDESYVARGYEPPRGEAEETLAGIWSEVLGVERVGRQDNFFELGGHSLLAVTVIERMRRAGLHADVGALFTTPTLSALAAAVGGGSEPIEVPPNGIPGDCEAITPPMLPLVELTQEEIERIVATVPGGAANVQDIYPLAPLQEGMLFHHLVEGGRDPYVLQTVLSFDSRSRLDGFVAALRGVIERHDILRTAVVWEGLREPVQVVWRRAPLLVEEVELDAGDAAERLRERIESVHYRLDVRQAPLMRLFIAADRSEGRWVLLWLYHHMIGDQTTAEVLRREIGEHLLGRQADLPAPLPFRNFVAQARLGVSREEHAAFFKEMLGDVDEPTVPFGLSDVRRDGSGIAEAAREADGQLAQRLRSCARRLGVGVASLCHLAFGRVLCETAGRDDVVFGTVLFGRMQGGDGADRVPGLFINTLPMRVQSDEGVAASVRTVHERLARLLRHEHAPLALAQRCSGVAAPTPLFSALLNYRHVDAPAIRSAEEIKPGASIRSLGSEVRTNYPLALAINDEARGRFSIVVRAQRPLEPKRICGYMNRVLEELVEALEREPQKPLRELEVMPEEERREVLVEWNRTAAQYPQDRCLHELFEAQVRRTPDAVAVSYEGQQVSYRELNARANRLARHLRGLGVGPDRVVALCVERSVEMVVGLLGILKAGGAYLPLDPSYPLERLAYMVGDSTPMVVLTHAEVESSVREALRQVARGAAVVDLRADAPSWASCSATNPQREAIGLTPKHLAYVIYTSGSTGRPKGVAVSHGGVVNLLYWMQKTFALERWDAVLQKAPFTFDVSVWEFFWPLVNGARVVIARPEGHKDPDYLVDVIQRERITTLHFVPPMLRAFLRQEQVGACSTVARVLCGGESLPGVLARECRKQLSAASLFHLYGPTEATVDVTSWACATVAEEQMPIGRPIANAHIYVLDGEGEPVPVGVTGELYVGGAGLARGYLNRPELTAERFVPDPHAEEPGSRLYRTGDLAKWRVDGAIEFHGRNDFQVKVRGFRIELGEIEAQLRAYPAIAEAAVVARDGERGEPDERRLVAYYTPTEREAVEPLSLEVLRAHLRETLPEYMIPSAYVQLASLPLTPSGKLDRKALPEPGAESYVARGYEPPRGDTETALAAIWAEVLGVDRVGRHDNFFELGGHSLLAMRVIERMRQARLHADVGSLFMTPTLAALAVAVGGGSEPIEAPPNGIPADCEAITPPMLPLVELTEEEIERIVATVPGGAANVQDIYPLAPLQEGMLFHHLAENKRDPYVLQTLLSFDTRALLDGFVDALRGVIERHDILRTAVLWEGLREPVQVVWRRVELTVEEVGTANAEQLRERITSVSYHLDVRRAPLMRVFIAEDRSRGRWVLLWVHHHLIGDHTTSEVIHREILAHQMGRQSELPAPLPFRTFVAQARLGLSREQHETFFKEMLRYVDEPTIPFGMADVRGDGSRVTEAWRDIDLGVVRRLRAAARRAGASVATLCHLAFGRVLAQVSGRDDVVFGTVLFGRMQGGEGADWVPGLFINTLPIRVTVGEEGVGAGIRTVHERLAGLVVHEHASLALAQRCSGVAAPAPLFTALLNYRHGGPAARSPDELRATRGIQFISAKERTNYPFTLSVNDSGERLSLIAHTQQPLEPKRICGYMNRVLEELVEALEREPQKPLRELEVMPEEERREVLVEWNRTAAQYPQDRCLHELFEAQVRRTPDAVAVSYEGQQVSYRELNARANRLARHLRGLGVGPDRVVALCVERSVEMVVGLLGILKAGGAYLPLDPSYPLERLAYMVGDSTPMVVLTHAEVESSVREALRQVARGAAVVDLRADAPSWATCSATNPQREAIGLTPKHLAYVIYTSGSTGRPKGVMVEHAEVCNTALAQVRAFEVAPTSRVLQFASLSFDACVSEVAMALCSGAVLQLPPASALLVGETLLSTLIESNTTHVTLPPAVLAGLPPEAASQLPALRMLVSAGEALPDAVSQRWARGRRLINAYGPTEAAICATVYECGDGGGGAPPIGRPIANARTYVLDGRGEPVPVGVTGELYIGGAGVARGYLNRPELTAERFVPDAYGEEPGARLYRTGDLARYRADGNLEFLGRNDFQVKVRGFRIELGEIEAQLRACPGIGEAVVVVRGEQAAEQRLVAYYTRAAGAEPPRVEALRSRLLEGLPEHMVPAAYVELEALPLTANGKLDRKGLPEPGDESYVARGYEPPRGEAEETLAGIWSEVLGVERVGRQDNFFELGGHSLLAVTVIERMRRAGLHADVGALFATPTIAELVAGLDVEPVTALVKGAVSVRATGTQSPLFLFHEVTGTDKYFSLLVGEIDSDVPIYGLPGIPFDEPQLSTIEALAARMVTIIRAIQPNGPYRLAGWSFGGLLAYEVAVQLLGDDEVVEFVGLLDTSHPSELTREMRLSFGAMTPQEYLLDNFVAFNSAIPEVEQRQMLSRLRDLSKQIAFEDLVRECAERKILASQIVVPEELHAYVNRLLLHGRAMIGYAVQPIPIPIYLFATEVSVENDPIAHGAWLGWDRSVPESQIRRMKVPGSHSSMLQPPNVAILGAAMSDALGGAGSAELPARTYDPLVPIHMGGGNAPTAVCLPGAGANVTDFLHLGESLGTSWTLYGLQSRGLDGLMVPHASVETAASLYAARIEAALAGPIHLIGHSYGGWIAFELANRFQQLGRPVLSVTLVDTEVPDGVDTAIREYTAADALLEFIDTVERSTGKSLAIDRARYVTEDPETQLAILHEAMARSRVLPRKSSREILLGPTRAFATALRTRYRPRWRYTGKVHLVFASDPRHDDAANGAMRFGMLAGWRQYAVDIDSWQGPGNHMTILDPPHVDALAKWWFGKVG